jgi:hypothetical protein
MRYFCLLSFFVLISACVPQQQTPLTQAPNETQTNTNAASATPLEEMQDTQMIPELLGTTLTIPEITTQLVLDESMVGGTLTDLKSEPKGTLELHTTRALQITNTPYVILPGTVSLVTGGGGVYLFLLEQQADSFVQRQAVNLGVKVELLTLEQSGSTITSITVDPRAGKPPFTTDVVNPPKPGKKVFELRDGQLLEKK